MPQILFVLERAKFNFSLATKFIRNELTRRPYRTQNSGKISGPCLPLGAQVLQSISASR